MRLVYFIVFVCGFVAWGQDCSSPSATTHYKVEKIVKKRKQLTDAKFINSMRVELMQQISSAVSVDARSSTRVSNSNESSNYINNINVTSSGLIINPEISICLDKITLSVEKKFVHNLSKNYLTRVINSDTESMLTLIKNATTTNKTFLKTQYKLYLVKGKHYAGLVPLALESKQEFSLIDYEYFKSTLALLGSKANSTIATRAISYVKPKKVSRVATKTYTKPKTVSKQSGGYYNTKTTYNKYKKGATFQAKAGVNMMGDFLTDNTRVAQVYNLEIMAGDVTYKDGALPIGIGYKFIHNSNGQTDPDGIEYDDNLMQTDFGFLYAKAGFAVGAFEMYMTYGKSLTKLDGEYNFAPETSRFDTFTFREPNVWMYGYGISIPLHKNFTLYCEYATVDIDYLNPGGTEAQKSSSNISFGININLN